MGRVEHVGRRLRTTLVVVATLLLLPVGRASADENADRDKVRADKAAVAAQLDELQASDAQLLAAVDALDDQVRAQQSQVADAQAAADAADRDAQRVRGDIAVTEAKVAELETQVRARAVASYVNPNSRFDTSEIVLRSDDLGESERQKVLAESVTGNDRDVVDQLRAAKAELAVQRQQADDLAAEATRHRQDAEAKLAELEAAKADQQRLRDALAVRIADAQSESAGLAAEDARLTQLIQAREAEAQRQAAAAAEAQRRASTPSTTAAVPGAPTTSTPAGAGSTSSTTSTTIGTRPPTSGGLIWPVSGMVSSEFGPRWGTFHPGIDIAAPIGTPVVAAKGGVVISAGFNGGGYGNLVLIDHGGGFVTAYAHLSAISVSAGQSVGQGQSVGAVGCTGSCTGPHLHFETRVNGSVQNPRSYLP